MRTYGFTYRKPFPVKPRVAVVSLVLFSALYLSFIPAFEQQHLKYDVIRNGKIIGQLSSIKTTKNNVVEYRAESNVEVNVIFAIKIYTFVSGVFSNGQLTDGKIIRRVNGKDKANAHIYWSHDKYYIREEMKTKEFKDHIYYTTACLMNREPLNLTRIFSENYQKFLDIIQVKPHQYKLSLPDGNYNYYTYTNGICTEAKISTTFSTAYFRLKK